MTVTGQNTTGAVEPEDLPARMDGVLRPVTGVPGREDGWLPSPCVQNHAAFLVELGNGDLGCAWFGGTMEGMSDISIHFSRLPKGADRWGEPVRLSHNPERSDQNPVLAYGPDGRLWLFYTSQPSGHQDQAVIEFRTSTDDGGHFTDAQRLAAPAGTFIRQPPVTNARGDWLVPAFRCVTVPGRKWRGDADTAAVMVSSDTGATWTAIAVPDSLGAVHMNIVPLGSDRMLAFFRDRFAEAIRISRSEDGGRTWTAPVATELPNNNSSIQATRLESGRIALVYNHRRATASDAQRASLYDEVGGAGEPDGESATPSSARQAVWGIPRAPLVIALSEDEGRTFPFRRCLEDGPGTCLSNNSESGANREFSYPVICQTRDGALNVAFTYYRRAIKHVRISEEWIMDPAEAFAPDRT